MVCHVDRRSFITHAAVIGTAVTVQSAEEAQLLSMLQHPQEKPAESSSSGAMPTGTRDCLIRCHRLEDLPYPSARVRHSA